MPTRVDTENAATFIHELGRVLRGEHPRYRGDRCYNAEFICFTYGRTDPEAATVIADDIEANIDEASDISELHPDRCRQIVNYLRGGIEYHNKYGEVA